MLKSDLLEAEREAKRFLERVKAIKPNLGENWVPGGDACAAIKRSSLDLSKALSKLRKSGY